MCHCLTPVTLGDSLELVKPPVDLGLPPGEHPKVGDASSVNLDLPISFQGMGNL